MGIVKKYIKKVRNMFHIPGEDVIILGLDDRNKSLRFYDLYVKTGPKFESKMESKVIEGNIAQVFLWYARTKIDHIFYGEYDPHDPNILHISFDIDKREGCIFKTDDKPEGIVYLTDMQTGQGAQLVRKKKVVSPFSDVPDKIVEETSIADESYALQTIPQQIRLNRDPVIDMLVSVNPYLLGSAIDSVLATELLRGKVEMWKMILIGVVMLIFGLVIGMGM